jgi:calcineurin-like phosphoesterase family protein
MIKIQSDSKGRFPDVWITSDTHYGHKNICRGVTNWRLPDGSVPISQTRDFKTIEQMNDTIVNNINEVVKQEDILIHLGDWSFGGFENIRKFYDRIICKNIHLILGNHDHHIMNNRENIQELFLTVSHYETLVIGKREFRLMHYPISSWDGLNKGVMHLHGHCHLPTELRFGKGKRIDVGIDGHPSFKPYHLLRDVIPMLEKRPIASDMGFDHHLDELENKDVG